VDPLEIVDVKSRVEGELLRLSFSDGQEVQAGALLAQIDPRPFVAQLEQAKAVRAKDSAQLADTRLELDRAAKLLALDSIARQAVDTLTAQAAQEAATVKADSAAIEAARLNLGFTRIVAPISGRVGLQQIHPGAMVRAADATGIVTVTQMTPIAVVFPVSQDHIQDLLDAQAQGPAPVVAFDRTGGRELARGRLQALDSRVEAASGQLQLKAVFDNPRRLLWPGAFVEARILLRTDRGMTVIPARAVLRGEAGAYVYVVQGETVAARPIIAGETVGESTEVRGVAPGEWVVTDGQARLAPGVRVSIREGPG
jgi:multidrug efflux system membrane fusion protein